MAIHPISFLLNEAPAEVGTGATAGGNPVSAPAYSLTKVLSAAAVIVAPLTTLLIDQFTKLSFTTGQIVALIVAILGFLAIASSADVLARAMAAAADSRAKAVTAAAGSQAKAVAEAAEARAKGRTAAEAARSDGADSHAVMLLDKPLAGQLKTDGENPRITVLAVRGGSHNRLLVAQKGQMSWVDEDQVYYP